jgi:ABC-type Fe3+-citrate transport system substrate-binding protein
MTMHKINRHRSANRSPMRVGVAAVVPLAVFALVVAACSDDDDNEVTVEFTGDGCVYSGPTEFLVGDEFEITVIDVTEERMDVGYAVLKVPDGTSVADVREQGVEQVAESDPEILLFAEVTEEGAERVMSGTLDVAGTWLLNCFVFNPDGDFPATTIEVVKES